MIMPGSSNQAFQPYKYNGKEFVHQDGLNLYDYGARWYDPARTQFTTLDPMAEKYPWISPYAYCNNNPVNLVDPTGMDWYQAENGNVIWRKSQDLEYKDDNDNVWKNIGTEYLVGSGKNAILFKQRENEDGELYLRSSSFDISTETDALAVEKETVLNMQNSDWSRDAAQNYWDNPTMSNWISYVFKEVLSQYTNPYLVVGGLSTGVAGLSSVSPKVVGEFKYAPRVIARALEDPVSHNFPYSFDKVVLSTKPTVTPSGYKIYQFPGAMNGKNGFYEIGVNGQGIIDHRFFRPK
jgi:RHS repeat-associated protein